MDFDDDVPGTEAFPYPTSIERTDFKHFDPKNVDEFLFKNHRFTSIDVLVKELSVLSKNLNQTLLDLVNNDYNDFIRLGKSVHGGLGLIDSISGDLKGFKLDLLNHHTRLDASHEAITAYLERREQILYYKTLAKVGVLLNEQITSFENLLVVEETTTNDKLNKVKGLTGLYLSITNLFAFLRQPDTPSNEFLANYLINKVSSLKLEFRSYLDQTVVGVRGQLEKEENHDLALVLLNVYKVLGQEKELLRIIGKKR